MHCIGAVMSADDEQTPAAKQKAAKQKGANRGAAVARLLGPLDKAYAKMDADGDGKVTEEEFGKHLETASNGRVKGQLGSQIFRTYDENGDGNLTLAELLKLETPAPPPAPSDAAKACRRDARGSCAAGRPGAARLEESALKPPCPRRGSTSCLPHSMRPTTAPLRRCSTMRAFSAA